MVEEKETKDCSVVLRGCGEELEDSGDDVLVAYHDLFLLCQDSDLEVRAKRRDIRLLVAQWFHC